jgi:ribosomal protein S24E
MNLSIQSKEENHLLGRQDVTFNVEFESSIPSRAEVRAALATAMSVPGTHVVMVRLDGRFGVHTATGVAHVYTTPAAALKDKKHLLIRDKLAVKEAKAAPVPKARKA